MSGSEQPTNPKGPDRDEAPEWTVHLPRGVSAEGVELRCSAGLASDWTARWAEEGGRTVVADLDGRSLSASQLEEMSRAVAGRFCRAGLTPGDRILLSLESSVELVVAHVAALRLGLVVVPANTSLTERELRYVFDDTRPSAAVVDDEARALSLGDWGGPSLVVTGPAVDLPDGEPSALDQATGGDPALVCFTSGTTGRPKGAVLTHQNLYASTEALRLAWRWSPEDRLVLPLPLFHMHGLGVGLHGTLHAGASVQLLPRFGVDSVLAAVAAPTSSMLFGVPTMYGRFARSGKAGELGRLRLCVSGSAPLPPDLHLELARSLGQPLLERYGMTETMMNCSNPYEGERRAGRVGFALPGVEVRIDADGESEGGEILVRGPNVTPGYWCNKEATDRSFDQDRWFRTGDTARRDSDGYVEIVGRTKELIITGGYNVYPREIEEVLLSHPAVLDAAVVGLPSDEWGEEVTAFITADERPDQAELVRFAAARLAPYKRPKKLHLVDEIPRNAMGKVVREQLRPR